MSGGTRFKLFLMMVLEFFIWGAWLPLVFGYLPSIGFSADKPPAWLAAILPDSIEFLFSEQSLILNTFPFAAIVGMFFSNQFADRHFAAERFLAFSHFVGGLAILGLAYVTDFCRANGLEKYHFAAFFSLMLIHCLLYVPTISITNSIAFAQMRDPQKEFGIIRMGGTIGWILAAWPFVFIKVDWEKVAAAKPQGFVNYLGTALATSLTGEAALAADRYTFIVAGFASVVLALFSLILPHTPPKRVANSEAGSSWAWVDAVKLLAHPFIFILWVVALIDSFVHNCYFNWTGRFLSSPEVGIASNWITPVMSIGQIAEILTMFILGAVLVRLGWKMTLILGVLGHAARFATYAFFPEYPQLIIAIQVLHGICYAFFFATVYIFVDEYFPKHARASAQGLFNLMILGVGALLAGAICPRLFDQFVTNGGSNYPGLFKVPMYLALVAAGLLLLLFWPPPAAAIVDDRRDRA
jgi:MFS family permease